MIKMKLVKSDEKDSDFCYLGFDKEQEQHVGYFAWSGNKNSKELNEDNLSKLLRKEDVNPHKAGIIDMINVGLEYQGNGYMTDLINSATTTMVAEGMELGIVVLDSKSRYCDKFEKAGFRESNVLDLDNKVVYVKHLEPIN